MEQRAWRGAWSKGHGAKGMEQGAWSKEKDFGNKLSIINIKS